MQSNGGQIMLLSELRIGEGYEVRDKRALIGTVRLIVHKGRLKMALDFDSSITLTKTQDAEGCKDADIRSCS